MFKKILIISVFLIMIFNVPAFAFDSKGEVIFRDSLYGAAIGAIIGTAFYLLDQKDFDKKLGSGVVIGTFGGLVYGLAENSGFVEIEEDNVRFALPAPVIEKEKDDNYRVSASLIKARF